MIKFIKNKCIYNCLIEVSAFFALLWSLSPLFFYDRIDKINSVPIHFNIKGEADRWGDPSYLLGISFLSLTFFIILSVLQKHPKVLNYPIKITESNVNELYKLGIDLVRHLKLFLTSIFAYLNSTTLASALGNKIGVNGIILSILLCLLLINLIFYSLKIHKLKDT